MNIKEYYLEKCKDKDWYNRFYQCGDTGDGAIFKCFSTNYRDLSAFEYYFLEFKKYIGLPRNKWNKKESTGQEVAKQYVVNMVESFLYLSKRNKDNELIYELSSRGEDFDKMLNSDFSQEEKTLLTYIYLMNSSFKNTPRYFLKQSWNVLECWTKSGLNVDKCIEDILNLINNEMAARKVENIFKYDIVWYLSFYTDNEFIKLYNISTSIEKEELKGKTIEDYKLSNKLNVVSYKYKGTNFSKPMLINTLLIIFLSKFVKDSQNEDFSFNEFYESLVANFSKIYTINKEKVLSFILENETIFKIIFKNAISEEDDFTERYIPIYRPEKKEKIEDLLAEKIDATSQEGVAKLEVVRSVLKKLAKEKSQYKCALHDINNCNYFTSKDEHKNYLEIHHLVPREFSYNFEDTIEFVENYIPLCPRCHRMIHKAEDRERIGLINYLFSQRHEELEKHNIHTTLKELYDFYKIDKDK